MSVIFCAAASTKGVAAQMSNERFSTTGIAAQMSNERFSTKGVAAQMSSCRPSPCGAFCHRSSSLKRAKTILAAWNAVGCHRMQRNACTRCTSTPCARMCLSWSNKRFDTRLWNINCWLPNSTTPSKTYLKNKKAQTFV